MSDVFGAAQDLQQTETASAPPAERTQKVFKPADMPMGRILAAVMRSSAAVQGQEQVKKVAGEQAASMSKMTVTMKQNPAGGPPLVTVKDAPADMLNGTQAEDVGKAYTTPKEQVEKKISATGMDGAAPQKPATPAAGANAQPEQPTMAPRALEQAALPLDENYGYRIPRPWDPDIHNPTSPDYKLGSEEGLRKIAEELNLKDPRAEAHRAWKQLRSGKVRPEAVAQRIATIRAKRIEQESADFEATRAPAEARANRSSIEADRLADNARLEKQQQDMERARITAAQQNVVKQIDFTLVDDAVLNDPEKLRQYIEDRNDSGVPLTDRQLRVVQNQARQDVAAEFKKFISHTEQFALADHPTWEAAKTAFGHSLSPAQEQQGRAAWQAARSYVQRTTSAADRKARMDDLRYQRTLQVIRSATSDKPAEIGRADLALYPVSELLATDPNKVKGYDGLLRQKQGLLEAEIKEKTTALNRAKVKADAIRAKGDMDGSDAEQLAGYDFEVQDATQRIAAATADLQTLQAKRAERGANVPAVKYKIIANGKYAPQVEKAIEAHMKKYNMGRLRAVKELRVAGFLE